eukprot:TRINITY_DN17144_c0_g1_i2.p1 TRINITY_DN17144_c0_g1~~TRINITY_DN17144_c0_g1_i2.p1  ORF type:complete len:142 (+),score=38.52 TRINITY_DN17144_c0_g1_i2:144-569(+)
MCIRDRYQRRVRGRSKTHGRTAAARESTMGYKYKQKAQIENVLGRKLRAKNNKEASHVAAKRHEIAKEKLRQAEARKVQVKVVGDVNSNIAALMRRPTAAVVVPSTMPGLIPGAVSEQQQEAPTNDSQPAEEPSAEPSADQ